jgi:hypothetical protein
MTRTLLLAGAAALWLVALLALIHVMADASARRRSVRYRRDWPVPSSGAYWLLGGSWLAGVVLAAVAVFVVVR